MLRIGYDSKRNVYTAIVTRLLEYPEVFSERAFLCGRRLMNVCPLAARTALRRNSGSRSPFSAVTTQSAGKYLKTEKSKTSTGETNMYSFLSENTPKQTDFAPLVLLKSLIIGSRTKVFY